MDSIQSYSEIASQYAAEGAVKVGAALLFWIVGRWLIGLVGRLLQEVMQRQKVDPTLMRYLGNILSVMLNIALVVAILGYCGIETTSFAALVAGVGIAIGAAWGGLLSNLAAGAFLIVLKPFKVGDFISAGGVTGTVKEIGLFATAIDTPDNVLTIIGNNKIFGDNIQNYSHNAFRRVELKCQLAGSADHVAAMELLRARILIWSDRCWRCVRSVTTIITGRCISTATGRSVKRWLKRVSRHRHPRSWYLRGRAKSPGRWRALNVRMNSHLQGAPRAADPL
jgi:small conductance mechanosensitive channel